MATTHTITGSIADWVPGVDPRHVRAVAHLNIPASEVVVEDSGTVWTASKAVNIDATLGTFAAELLATDAIDLNVEPDTLRWTIQLSVVDQQTRLVGQRPQANRRTITLGPFPVTADGNIGDLTEHFDTPAVSPQWRSTFAAEMEDVRTQAVADVNAIKADVAADKADVAADRAYVEGIVVTDLGTTDGQTKALIESPTSQTAGALSAAFVRGLNVTAYGVGTTKTPAENAAALTAAIRDAAGRTLHVPSGVYESAQINLDTPSDKAILRLAEGAVLRHKGGLALFNMVGGSTLDIAGGTLDGAWQDTPAANKWLIIAHVPTGVRVELDRVRVINSGRSVISANNFGGVISMTNCHVSGQKEHNGTIHSTVVSVGSGQEGAKGLLRFNHNTCVYYDTPAIEGANPGGVFFATNGYDTEGGGGSGTEGFANGNQSTFEAIGNYFYGYGQHTDLHDISPLHCYPTIAGARFIGNFFEKCGFSAISAKSVQDFVCTDNVILNGDTSSKNTASEGAILYGPGYQAGSKSRPRAVITGNIVTNPGGQPTQGQTGISLRGTPTSYATDVTVSGNVITNTGQSITGNWVKDATITGNVIRPFGSAAIGSGHGISLTNAVGDVRITNNDIIADGDGVVCAQGSSTARLWVEGNLIRTVAGTHRTGANLRGVAFAKITGNTFEVPTGNAVTAQANAAANQIGKLVYDRTNTILAGTVSLVWANIDDFEGQAPPSGTPTIALSAPAGTGATGTVTGNSDSGRIQIVTGASGTTTTGGAATITFATPRRVPPKAIILTPASPSAAIATAQVYISHATLLAGSFALTVRGTPLSVNTTYDWFYQVLD